MKKHLASRQNNSTRASALQITLSIALIPMFSILLAASLKTAAPVGATNADALTATPTLGNYPSKTMVVSENAFVAPDAPPANATGISARTDGNFNGIFVADPTTGVVRVTNAHPAGTYSVTVTAFNSVGMTATRTFSLTVVSGLVCNGTIQFTDNIDVSVGSNPQNVVIGDFNNDGKQDLATANYDAHTVSIRLGDGLGGFSGTTDISVGGDDLSVAVGDFNNDGKLDLATANAAAHTVSIRLGDGLGGFSGTTEVSVSGTPSWIALGDFNNDGKLDFAAANYSDFTANTVSIRLGDGLGGFSGNTEVSVAFRAGRVVVGDFNNDGNLDFATAHLSPPSVSIRLGDGLGGFSGTTSVSVPDDARSVAFGDFNKDGNQDFAAAHSGHFAFDHVSIRLGDGLGGFSGTTEVSVADGPQSIALGDFNNDGKLDFATANQSSTVSIRLGDGLGGFSGNTDLSVAQQPQSIAIGDFNSDGHQDFAITNYQVNTISIRMGVCVGSTPPPTVNISGTVRQCAGATSNALAGVTMALTGSSGSSTTTGASGNYTLSGFLGGTYDVTPTKVARLPGSAGVNTIDVLAVQRHFLAISLLTGCRLAAADCASPVGITTADVIAIQRFYLGLTTGFANVGKYQFTPSDRSYTGIVSDQTGQNYDALVFGDVASPFADRAGGSSQDGTSANEMPSTVEAVALPEVAVDHSGINFIARVTTTTIDAKNKLVGFQGDFTYDERVVTFANEPVRKAGMTGGNWNVSGNVLDGAGPMRTLRISAFSNDFVPLSGSGTLFELRMRTVSDSAFRIPHSAFTTPLVWAAPPDNFIFVDANLQTQRPGNARSGSITTSGKHK